MRYLDTSAAVPLYVTEAASPTVQRWFGARSSADIGLSGWTMTEFASALGMRVRMRKLVPATARTLAVAFRNLARRSLTLIPVEAADLERASELLLRFDLGLRAGDALHLAIAQNAGAAALVTLDKRLAAAAAQVGLTVEQPT